MKQTALILTTLLTLAACREKPAPTDEEQGAALLLQARQLLAGGQPQAARDTILSLRTRFPRALEARKQAILTLDSAELALARQEGDSLKTEFYLRKIQFDKQQ